MVIDAVEFKLYTETTVKHKRKPSEDVFKVHFFNKAVELISLLFIPFIPSNS